MEQRGSTLYKSLVMLDIYVCKRERKMYREIGTSRSEPCSRSAVTVDEAAVKNGLAAGAFSLQML